MKKNPCRPIDGRDFCMMQQFCRTIRAKMIGAERRRAEGRRRINPRFSAP
ncbi:hypothetical protein [Selenomonas sputigena]|uniref:Uncharacterized protein n=1 Tax=Selenomonas sputigena (strain ATCC 35185 / DSM 20758 / CCUG 44933 / VPI D19B-28) TaxID=546271 RepID=C9LX09_SELS3|nr:hypothetical protein [Selenomonas sputigena]EEX76685.1 hypothetical protein SELSPUOL_02015 [Selenomonas sputigena ATCC 35185]